MTYENAPKSIEKIEKWQMANPHKSIEQRKSLESENNRS